MAYPAYVWLKDNEGNDIKGGCTQGGRIGSVEVLALKHDVELPKDPVTSEPTGVRRHRPISFLKEFDQASPLLYKACCDGQMLKEIRIDWYKGDSAGKDIIYFTHLLENCRVTKVNAHMENTRSEATKDYGHLEWVEIVYSKVTWRHELEAVSHTDDWKENPSAENPGA